MKQVNIKNHNHHFANFFYYYYYMNQRVTQKISGSVCICQGASNNSKDIKGFLQCELVGSFFIFIADIK